MLQLQSGFIAVPSLAVQPPIDSMKKQDTQKASEDQGVLSSLLPGPRRIRQGKILGIGTYGI